MLLLELLLFVYYVHDHAEAQREELKKNKNIFKNFKQKILLNCLFNLATSDNSNLRKVFSGLMFRKSHALLNKVTPTWWNGDFFTIKYKI